MLFYAVEGDRLLIKQRLCCQLGCQFLAELLKLERLGMRHLHLFVKLAVVILVIDINFVEIDVLKLVDRPRDRILLVYVCLES